MIYVDINFIIIILFLGNLKGFLEPIKAGIQEKQVPNNGVLQDLSRADVMLPDLGVSLYLETTLAQPLLVLAIVCTTSIPCLRWYGYFK